MKNRFCSTNCGAVSGPGWRWTAIPCLLACALQLFGAVPAAAEEFPLPPWFIYGGGINGTWDGSSTGPDNARLTVTMNPPPVPNQHATAVATGSTDLLQMIPATTYTLTLSAAVSGLANCYTLMVDGVGVITNTSFIGTWKRYTNSFTTGGPDDPRVGRNLNVQLVLTIGGFSYGTSAATFTNIQFAVSTVRPRLTLHPAAGGAAQLLWSTNFYWYIPEQATNLESGVWEDLTNQATIQGDQFVAQVETKTGQRFFRLRQP